MAKSLGVTGVQVHDLDGLTRSSAMHVAKRPYLIDVVM
jgi:hypothetical protein